MTNRLFIKLLFCAFLSIANASKDLLPFGKLCLKSYACEFSIDELLKKEPLSRITSKLTEKEIKEIEVLKHNYCKSSQGF